MQDIHTIGVGGGGRLFGGGERRLRPHHHQGHGPGQSPKCPRCDSVNTKFCYYNNYNLSQPRHFCKSCRRYWTKGGVLRNVPVGGGCRKAKRSAKTSLDGRKKSDDKSQSSSESSSLTASVAVPENGSDMASCSMRETSPPADEQILVRSPPPKIFDYSQSTANPILDPMTSFSDPSDGIEIGSFTSMMTSSSNPLMGFDFGYRLQLQSDGKVVENQSSTHQQWTHLEETTTTMPEELKMQDISGGFLDSTVQMDLTERHHNGLGTLDHELFGDLTATVDQSYWNQPQWTDVNEHALYLP